MNSPSAWVLTWRMKSTNKYRNKVIFLRFIQSIWNISQVCHKWSEKINSFSLILTLTIQNTYFCLSVTVLFILILVVFISFTYAACTHPALCAFAHVYELRMTLDKRKPFPLWGFFSAYLQLLHLYAFVMHNYHLQFASNRTPTRNCHPTLVIIPKSRHLSFFMDMQWFSYQQFINITICIA